MINPSVVAYPIGVITLATPPTITLALTVKAAEASNTVEAEDRISYLEHSEGHPLHDHPLSTSHFSEHPSPSSTFESSHYSPMLLSPFPHFKHLEGDPDFSVQVKPFSIVQVDEHPSPEASFPSSHSVNPKEIFPSPQTSQVSGELEVPPPQFQPSFTPEVHPLLHPISLFNPSSQTSPDYLYPSPHLLHFDFAFSTTVQLQPSRTSILHSELQPSPFSLFPSSHLSEGSLTPFPHS